MRISKLLSLLSLFLVTQIIPLATHASVCKYLFVQSSFDPIKNKYGRSVFSRMLEDNEPALKYILGDQEYRPLNRIVWGVRRKFNPKNMLRFNCVSAIKMFRGYSLDSIEDLRLGTKSSK